MDSASAEADWTWCYEPDTKTDPDTRRHHHLLLHSVEARISVSDPPGILLAPILGNLYLLNSVGSGGIGDERIV
jgi:hypothetical protein